MLLVRAEDRLVSDAGELFGMLPVVDVVLYDRKNTLRTVCFMTMQSKD